ncbi:thiamine phosphate synthase [Corynebacterium felinum]|uniref:Thiamine-phosphate synthase n=2 Tax=Corynebacterium felinum TaxID=131318 RepID=A0ABU2BBN7_9CORY|nr:thiamine phosphate synthase [Corynebacterium felinum]MDR7356013.1 thiamine-phosphate pyrophosphorylase [Corynebacterium felinum]
MTTTTSSHFSMRRRAGDVLDLSTYLVTGENPFETVRHAQHATCIQVRSKPIEVRDLYQLSCAIAEVIRPDQLLLIDDRVDVALALRARGIRVDGVHLGQTDLPVHDARALLGPDAIIGLTTGTRELVEKANDLADVIDYIGAGPFRPSPTKVSNRPPLGIEGMRQLVELSKVPVVAIGDIWPKDAPALFETGVSGIAMVRAFVDNPGLCITPSSENGGGNA